MKHIIGSDETLKGDSFGGLVVAAVYIPPEKKEAFQKMGVGDSKKILDTKIMKLATWIESQIDSYAVASYFPEEYNNYSLTSLMNRLHTECAEKIRTQYPDISFLHIVDKFPGCVAGDVSETKAEDNYLEVAAASILARAAGLQQMEELTTRAGFTIPKGSTHVTEALEELKKRKLEPAQFVKLHFKNVRKILFS